MSGTLTQSIRIGTVLILLFISQLEATERLTVLPTANTGVFVALNLPRNSVGGDFDGTNMLVSDNEVMAVPKLNTKFATAFAIGYRWERSAIEFSYSKTSYKAKWLGSEVAAETRTFSFDYRGYSKSFLIASRPAQAFVQTGFSVVPLKAKDAAVAVVNDEYVFGDANFTGVGFTLGGGIETAIAGRLGLSFGVGYRLLRYFSCEGALGNSTIIEDGLSGNGFLTTLNLNFKLIG